MTSPADFIHELEWRGLLFQTTEGAREALSRGPVSGYCGFDPTAPSLHVGNLVPVMGLVHLQRTGHKPIALVGGVTGLIGDPSGRSAERVLTSADVVETNARSIAAQLESFLDFDGPSAARMRNNAEWLLDMRMVEFLRDAGKYFTINSMLSRDAVKNRLESGISYTEFSYMLLQAYDYLELYRREGVTLQLGGSDQWGNITGGTELIRRAASGEAHGVTLPLITTASGLKFGKSESGAVYLDPALTSTYRFYQFWMNADDRDAGRYLRFFTLLTREEIEEIERASAEAPERRIAQHALALDVTSRVHGADAARTADSVSALLFGKADPMEMSLSTIEALADEVPYVRVDPPVEGSLDTLDLFISAQLAASRGAARRLLEQGGLSINGRRLGADDRRIATDVILPGGHLLLRKGAREYALVRLAA